MLARYHAQQIETVNSSRDVPWGSQAWSQIDDSAFTHTSPFTSPEPADQYRPAHEHVHNTLYGRQVPPASNSSHPSDCIGLRTRQQVDAHPRSAAQQAQARGRRVRTSSWPQLQLPHEQWLEQPSRGQRLSASRPSADTAESSTVEQSPPSAPLHGPSDMGPFQSPPSANAPLPLVHTETVPQPLGSLLGGRPSRQAHVPEADLVRDTCMPVRGAKRERGFFPGSMHQQEKMQPGSNSSKQPQQKWAWQCDQEAWQEMPSEQPAKRCRQTTSPSAGRPITRVRPQRRQEIPKADQQLMALEKINLLSKKVPHIPQ